MEQGVPHLPSELALGVPAYSSGLLSLWKHVGVFAKECATQGPESIEHGSGVDDNLAL